MVVILKPAVLYKDELIDNFKKVLYTQDYFYYCGWDCGSELPQIKPREGLYQYAIIDSDKVVGFFTYEFNVYVDAVRNFGLFSFDRGNPVVGKDIFKKMRELIKIHHKVEWSVVDGNPVMPYYDRFCNKYGGNKLRFRDATKDLNGNYIDTFMYEVINSNRI